jgi:hypothetical protein
VQAVKDNLNDVKVFVVGKGAEKDADVLGRTDSGWARPKALIVET